MIRNSLVLRLILLVLAVSIFSFAALVFIIHHSTATIYVEREIQFASDTLEEYRGGRAREYYQQVFRDGGLSAVRKLVSEHSASGDRRLHDLLLLDVTNRVLESSGQPWETASVQREPTGGLLVTAANVDSERELRITNPIELRDRSGQMGGLLVVLPHPPDVEAGTRFAAAVWESAAIGMLIVMGLAILATSLLVRHLLAPISQLTHAAQVLERGSVPAPIAPTGGTEFRQLIEAFNSAAASLSQTDRVRRQLIGDIAHELRTPVTNLRVHLEAATSGLVQSDADLTRMLLAETTLLERLIEDFQQLALSDAGQLHLNMQPLYLAETMHQLMHALVGCSAEVQIEIPEEIQVLADETRWRQVIANLVENSLRYSLERPHISIQAHAKTSLVEMIFRDDGPGISVSDRPHIFDRFYRGEKSRNRCTGGAGLGLSITTELIEAMGGSIAYVDTEQRGTAFKIELRKP